MFKTCARLDQSVPGKRAEVSQNLTPKELNRHVSSSPSYGRLAGEKINVTELQSIGIKNPVDKDHAEENKFELTSNTRTLNI